MATVNSQSLGQRVKDYRQVVSSLLLNFSIAPTTFNYAFNGVSPSVFDYLYEGLTFFNPVTGKIEPDLAESWEVSEGGHRFVFKLRDDLKWSDGQPLTADDVVFTYRDIYLNPEIPTDLRGVFTIGENKSFPVVKKLDDRHLEFTLPEPFAPFLNGTSLAILPAHALQSTITGHDRDGIPLFLETWGTNTDPHQIVVNGPYQLDNYDEDKSIIFKRNPHYWRRDDRGNAQPYIEHLTVKIIRSNEEILAQFREGKLDSMRVNPSNYSLLQAESQRGNFTIYNGGLETGTTFITFNLNQGQREGKPLVNPVKSHWFNQTAFRQAIAYALDRPKMLKDIFHSLGGLINSPIPPISPYYLSPEQGLPVYNYDPNRAKTLLRSSGFRYDSQGNLEDDRGNPVEFTLLVNESPLRPAMAAQIKENLGAIGVKVKIITTTFWELMDQVLNKGDWECLLLGFSGSLEPNDGSNIWQLDNSSHVFNLQSLQGVKIEGVKIADWEEKINHLYQQGSQELQEEKRQEIYHEAQKTAQLNLPFIYLVNSQAMMAVRNRVQPIRYRALGDIFWNIHELKILPYSP